MPGKAVITQPVQNGEKALGTPSLNGLFGHSRVRVCIWMGCLDTAKSEFVSGWAVWTQPSQSLYLDGLSGHSQVRVCIWMGCLDTAKSEFVSGWAVWTQPSPRWLSGRAVCTQPVHTDQKVLGTPSLNGLFGHSRVRVCIWMGCLDTAKSEFVSGWAVWTQPSQSLYLDGLSGHSQVRDGCQGGLSGHSPSRKAERHLVHRRSTGCLDTAESEFVSGWAVWTQPSQSLYLDGLSGHSQVRVCIWMGCLDTAKSEFVSGWAVWTQPSPRWLSGRAVCTQPVQKG
ncbi:hypothetical protein WMY93_007605 [Mugilogobius chulae]|uniref:Uncharacterized protein n=1 Tax=Mugilogobius chulae TaxID=88201 RepID=A0AAW0PP49_9GOBI